jgi:hypothetical protein
MRPGRLFRQDKLKLIRKLEGFRIPPISRESQAILSLLEFSSVRYSASMLLPFCVRMLFLLLCFITCLHLAGLAELEACLNPLD